MTNTQPFVPIIFGGNRGGYSLARALHEQYGVTSDLVLAQIVGPVAHSKILDYHVHPAIRTDFKTVLKQVIGEITAEYQGQDVPKIVFGSDDEFVDDLIAYRDVFPEDWIVPYVPQSVLKKAVDKSQFYQMCEKVGVPYPKTWHLKDPILPSDVTVPLVIKPAITPSYQPLHFAGKHKVYFCDSLDEASRALNLMRDNGYPDDFVMQEFIPGVDTDQAVVTCYRSPHDREIKMMVFGRIILEDHGPESIGNHLVILSEDCSHSVFQHVKQLMEAFDFTGFANFDLIWDDRINDYLFFELNPRLGVSNYYVTMTSHNVAYYYIEDYLYRQAVKSDLKTEKKLFSLVPKKLLQFELRDNPYLKDVKMCYREGQVVHPLYYPADMNWHRQSYIMLSKINFYRKFYRNYQELKKQSKGIDDR